MMYVVKKGYTYLDTKGGRNTPYVGGQEFSGVVDETQKWKLGELKPVEQLEVSTKDATTPRKAEAAKTKTAKELDDEEMDAGEE